MKGPGEHSVWLVLPVLSVIGIVKDDSDSFKRTHMSQIPGLNVF